MVAHADHVAHRVVVGEHGPLPAFRCGHVAAGGDAEVPGRRQRGVVDVVRIGDAVEVGQAMAVIVAELLPEGVAATPSMGTVVTASLTGFVRGLIRDGYPVTKGFKIADIDPRQEERMNCFTVSDKARCLGGSALTALLYLLRRL